MFSKSTITIPSITPEWALDLWRFLPAQQSGPLPVIIMAHGFSANKRMGLTEYAEAFATEGYACIVFDYRRWGASGGKPRHSVYVSEQLDDYRTVVKYCRQQPEFDPQRVILWGSSFSGTSCPDASFVMQLTLPCRLGGHAITLASEANLNICTAIAQCPWTGIGVGPSFELPFLKTLGYAILDMLKQTIGLSPVYIPATALPGEVGILTPPGSKSGMASIVKEQSDYPNEVSASSFFELPWYQPHLSAKNINCPLLVVAMRSDNLCYIQGANKVTNEAPNATLVKLEGGHFDLYPGNVCHKEALDAQVKFLKEKVPL
ncbi:hypothetical protein NLI96_g9636 [Meripilus lineatus]|uniref:Xaa-Pro dipeptidyl-peptidase-like domain-containing protein n=1 Tax=Meripilus lineatus TaxID=2056292 RepID=A0AAD5UV46_9APHY|nr:hypothetical protein NLI96_g9636 [Physisporinus lineatus]